MQAVHGAKGALDATVRYVQERQAFGQNLAQFQNTRFTLAQCATANAAAEAFLNACVHAYQRGELTPEAASALKLSLWPSLPSAAAASRAACCTSAGTPSSSSALA